MNHQDIICDIFAKVLDLPRDGVTEDLTPAAVEAWDSMKHIMFLLAVQEHFGLAFSDKEMTSVGSVGDVVRLAEAHGAQQGAA